MLAGRGGVRQRGDEIVSDTPGDAEAGVSTLYERLQPFIGVVNDLPPDMARNHDHYLHGVPKKNEGHFRADRAITGDHHFEQAGFEILSKSAGSSRDCHTRGVRSPSATHPPAPSRPARPVPPVPETRRPTRQRIATLAMNPHQPIDRPVTAVGREAASHSDRCPRRAPQAVEPQIGPSGQITGRPKRELPGPSSLRCTGRTFQDGLNGPIPAPQKMFMHRCRKDTFESPRRAQKSGVPARKPGRRSRCQTCLSRGVAIR